MRPADELEAPKPQNQPEPTVDAQSAEVEQMMVEPSTTSTPSVNVAEDIEAPSGASAATADSPVPAAEPTASPSSTPAPATSEAASPAPAQTAPGASAFETSQSGQPPKKSSAKKWIIGGVVGGVSLLLLTAGSVGAYMWYQNSEKVLDDALLSLATQKEYGADTNITFDTGSDAKGTLALKSDSNGKVGHVAYDVNADAVNETFKLSGGVYSELQGDMFVRVDGLEKLLGQYQNMMGGSQSPLPASVSNFIKKVDGNWVVITDKDIEEISSPEQKKMKECTESLSKKMQEDTSYVRELTDRYQQHRFIVIKNELGVKDGAYGYELSGDETQFIEFVKSLKNTKIYSEYRSCLPAAEQKRLDDGIDKIDSTKEKSRSATSDVKTTVTVWVDQWSHKFKKATVEINSKNANMKAETVLRALNTSALQKPDKAITVDELKKDIEKMEREFSSQYNTNSFNEIESDLLPTT